MENPPLQTSMQQGAEYAERSQSRLMRVVGPVLLALVFCIGSVSVFAYLSQASALETPPPVQPDPAIEAITRAFPTAILGAKAAIVVDIDTGRVLYERNADVQLPLASLTKVPLALAISEVMPLSTELTIPYDVPPTSKLGGLTVNSVWRAQDLIDLTLAASSNDGAQILAASADSYLRSKYPDAPQGGAAVYRMNEMARSLGLAHTYFLNTTGLDESQQQSGAYGSARDVATLFTYAASTSPDVFAATTRPMLTVQSLDGVSVTAHNTDHALDDIPGLIMGKTGLTDLAGGNLAVVFSPRPGYRVAAVVLGSTEEGRFEDMKSLVAAAVQAYGVISQ